MNFHQNHIIIYSDRGLFVSLSPPVFKTNVSFMWWNFFSNPFYVIEENLCSCCWCVREKWKLLLQILRKEKGSSIHSFTYLLMVAWHLIMTLLIQFHLNELPSRAWLWSNVCVQLTVNFLRKKIVFDINVCVRSFSQNYIFVIKYIKMCWKNCYLIHECDVKHARWNCKGFSE